MTEEHRLELFQYRVGLLLGTFFYPFFGWFSETYLNVDFDSFSERLPVSMFCLIGLILSYKIEFVRRYFRFYVLIASCISMHQYIQFFVQSNYHYYFSIGLTALPFVIFTVLFHPVDIAIFFSYMLAVGAYSLRDSNIVFIVTYSILIIMAFTVYLLVTRNRIFLLKSVRNNLDQIKIKQNVIEEKNKSLIKIGELAAQVAHDIRSPVGALQAVSEMLSDEVDPKKKKLIENAAKRINDIADNLVSQYRVNLTKDLSSVDINRSISLNSLIEDIVEEKKLNMDSNSSIFFDAPGYISVPNSINPSDFQRIISNIINNSIEAFNKPQSYIQISMVKMGNHIQIKISDNGKGIDNSHLDKIFEKGTSSKSKGAGLGLSHARHYLESIGGNIKIESSSSAGTVLVIEL